MLNLRHFLTVLGLALAVFVTPVFAVERSVGGSTNKNTKVDVQIETINTFIKSVKERLTKDINRELGYATTLCDDNPSDCRILHELERIQAKLDYLWGEFNGLDRNKIRGAEIDSHTCLYAKTETPNTACNFATQRLVWSGTAWECRTKAAWETGGAGACATATIPAPAGCSPVLLRNCCDRWVCGGTC